MISLGTAARLLVLAACIIWPAQALALCPANLAGPGVRTTRYESVYNIIYVHRRNTCASLSFRRASSTYLESSSNLADPTELPVPYTRNMSVGLAYVENPAALLIIGVGAGTMLNYLSQSLPQSTLVGVDLDPTVIEIARDEFGLREAERRNLRLAVSDGRIFIRRSRTRFDAIFLDAFRGGYIPEHLTSREFYELAKSRLNPGGILVANLHYGTALFDSSVATIRTVFARTDLYWADGNVIAIAGDSLPAEEVLAQRAQDRQRARRFRYDLPRLLQARMNYTPPRGTRTLSDDFSPANQLEAIASANRRRP